MHCHFAAKHIMATVKFVLSNQFRREIKHLPVGGGCELKGDNLSTDGCREVELIATTNLAELAEV